MSEFDEVMAFDPLDAVEKITGKSYKDKDVTGLGLLLHMIHSDQKQKMLSRMGDTYYRISYDDACKVIENSLLDFKLVFTNSFVDEDNRENEDRIYWSPPKGIIVHVCSYSWGKESRSEWSCNTVNAFYEYYTDVPAGTFEEQDKLLKPFWRLSQGSSGGMFCDEQYFNYLRARKWDSKEPYPPGRVYMGQDRDGREGLITHLLSIDAESAVKFNQNWSRPKFGERFYGMYLRTWMDWKNKEVNHAVEKIKKSDKDFQDWARECGILASLESEK